MRSKEKQRSMAQLTYDKYRYQLVSRKDLVKFRKTGTILVKKLFQYAEPLILNILNASLNLSSTFWHLPIDC